MKTICVTCYLFWKRTWCKLFHHHVLMFNLWGETLLSYVIFYMNQNYDVISGDETYFGNVLFRLRKIAIPTNTSFSKCLIFCKVEFALNKTPYMHYKISTNDLWKKLGYFITIIKRHWPLMKSRCENIIYHVLYIYIIFYMSTKRYLFK